MSIVVLSFFYPWLYALILPLFQHLISVARGLLALLLNVFKAIIFVLEFEICISF